MEALQKYSCPAACASQWRQPSLFGDDIHAVGTRPKWAREHGVHTEWSPMSVGCEPGSSTGARTRTRAEVNVRPRPLVQVNRRPVLPCASAPVLPVLAVKRMSRLALAKSCCWSRNTTWRLESGLPPKTLGCYVATSVVACLRVAFMNWRRSFSKHVRHRAQSTRRCQRYAHGRRSFEGVGKGSMSAAEILRGRWV